MAAPITFAAVYTRDEFPEEFNTHTFGPFASAALTGATTPLMVLPRACDIEQITVWMTTKPGQACDVTFKYAASGTAIASGTDFTTAADLNAGSNATTYQVTIGSGGKNLAAGTVIGITAGTATSLVGLVISIRTKNRLYRTTTSGSKQWSSPVTPA